MKNRKKFISTIVSLALAMGVISGGAVLSGCTYNEGSVSGLKKYSIMQTAAQIERVTGTGKNVYVSPEGTRDAEGTQQNPLSLTAALVYNVNTLQPGDTVWVTPGTYSMDLTVTIENSGTYDKYISVRATDPTQTTVIDFSGMRFDSTNRGVSINGNFWYWEGVDITGAGDNGMYIAGNYNIVNDCEFYRNRDSGLQLGRAASELTNINQWPSYNLIKNCTSYNNYDNETYGENADGFAAKLTVGYGNIFDSCIAYRNSDDGWDLYAKVDSGNIGAVILYNCVAFENGYLAETQQSYNARFPEFNKDTAESNTNTYNTHDGDGNGFKLGGSVMEGDVLLNNCLAFNNKLHGITDNSNPGYISLTNVTSYDSAACIDDDPQSATFGQIIKGNAQDDEDKGANINLSRQTYSYNHMSKVLSVKSPIATLAGGDEFRGSADNSILIDSNNTDGYKITQSIDADFANGINGEKTTALNADEVFVKVPVTLNAETEEYTYNLSGLANSSVHTQYRNSDGSINMGDMLKIADQSLLFGGNPAIGALLSEGNWDAYPHYDYTELSTAESQAKAILSAATDSVYVPCDVDACYQDFDVAKSLLGATVTWTSSDESVIKIVENEMASVSRAEYYTAVVYRPYDKDAKVTLTATVSYEGLTKTKTFQINVKKGDPSIGEIIVDGVQGGRIIVDQYSLFGEPNVSVENATDYNGKLLDESLYTLSTKYMYQEDKNSKANEVKGFTSSKAGVFQIIHTVTLKNSNQTAIYSYYIYVASTATHVDFVNEEAAVNVYKDGYIISGNLTNVTGSIYSLASKTELANVTADYIKANGEKCNFRNDTISVNFKNDNNGEYYIYYVVCNMQGEVTSKIYSQKVTVENISTPQQFIAMASSETSSSVIYMLTSNLDFSNINYSAASNKKSFKGLLNGSGYTVSNINVSSSASSTASVFYRLQGGTIMNVKFNNISLNAGTDKQAGIIGTCYGGYLYNLQLNNVTVSAGERAGGLIGQVFEGTPTYIEQVALNNGEITASSKDGGGLVGLIQPTSSASADVEITVANCFVDASVVAGSYAGGVIARLDDQNPTINFYLSIKNCYVIGSVKSNGNYCGGVLGGQQGVSQFLITNCVNMSSLYHKGVDEKLTQPQKNCSGIVGRYSSTGFASVTNCYSAIEEHNSNFNVEYAWVGLENTENFWKNFAKFDLTLWAFSADSAPYLTLNFIQND